MQYFAGGMILLVSGVAFGFALAKRKRRLAATIGLIVAVGIVGLLLIPRVTEHTYCRFDSFFWSEDRHPRELVGAWVGWDAQQPMLHFRLELRENGTGRCAIWSGYHREPNVQIWRVTRWNVSRSKIGIDLETGERREGMYGTVSYGAMELRYFGESGRDETWYGPLQLVSEDAEEDARRAIGEALAQR